MSFNSHHSGLKWDVIPAKVFRENTGAPRRVNSYNNAPQSSRRAPWHRNQSSPISLPPPPALGYEIPLPPSQYKRSYTQRLQAERTFEQSNMYYAQTTKEFYEDSYATMGGNSFSMYENESFSGPSHSYRDFEDDVEYLYEKKTTISSYDNKYSDYGSNYMRFDMSNNRRNYTQIDFSTVIDPNPRENIAFPMSTSHSIHPNFPPSTGFSFTGILPKALTYLQQMSISAGYCGVLNNIEEKSNVMKTTVKYLDRQSFNIEKMPTPKEIRDQKKKNKIMEKIAKNRARKEKKKQLRRQKRKLKIEAMAKKQKSKEQEDEKEVIELDSTDISKECEEIQILDEDEKIESPNSNGSTM